MNWLVWMDSRLIVWIETASQAFERITEKNNFWLAKQAVYLQIALFASLSVLCLIYPNLHPALRLYITTCMMLLTAFYGVFMRLNLYLIELIEEKVMKDALAGLSNQLKIQPKAQKTRIYNVLRIFLVGVISWIWFGAAWYIIVGCYVLDALDDYLRACDPLPPGHIKSPHWTLTLRRLTSPQPSKT